MLTRMVMLIGGLTVLTGPAAAAERYEVHWTNIWNEISPERTTVTTPGGLTLIVDGSRITTYSSKYVTSGTQDQTLQTINNYGVYGYNRYRITPSKVVNTYTSRGAIYVTTIVSDGAGGCRASILIKPVRGQRVMIWYGVNFDRRFASAQVADETCTLQIVPTLQQ